MTPTSTTAVQKSFGLSAVINSVSESHNGALDVSQTLNHIGVDSSSTDSLDSSIAQVTGIQKTESDVIVHLKANLAQLEDLQARMGFILGELSYLLIKSP